MPLHFLPSLSRQGLLSLERILRAYHNTCLSCCCLLFVWFLLTVPHIDVCYFRLGDAQFNGKGGDEEHDREECPVTLWRGGWHEEVHLFKIERPCPCPTNFNGCYYWSCPFSFIQWSGQGGPSATEEAPNHDESMPLSSGQATDVPSPSSSSRARGELVPSSSKCRPRPSLWGCNDAEVDPWRLWNHEF